MKKILSIILAILMIVTSVPFAFAESAESYFYKISHQPTVDEYYVETNDANATYQWYEMTADAYEIDDTCASPVQPSPIYYTKSSYDVETGWTPSVPVLGPVTDTLKYFSITFEDDETLTIQFSSDNIDEVYLDSNDSGDVIEITPDGNTATCKVKSGEWVLCVEPVESEEEITLRAWIEGGVAMDGETSAQLDTTKIKEGTRYYCEVAFSDGTSERSNNVLVHQHEGTPNCQGHKCTICGELLSDAIGDHTGTYHTCKGYKCTVCNEYFGEASGHAFNVYRIITEPTTKKPGTAVAECHFGCGATDTKSIPAKAEIDVVYDEAGNRVGIKSIYVDVEDAYFYDIFEGNGGAVEDLSAGEFYKKALTTKPENGPEFNTPLGYWGEVAANVFKTAGRGYGWQWDYGKNFNSYFGPDAEDDSNAAVDVAFRLGSEDPYSKGKSENDCVRSTGLQSYSSLSMVQDVMLEQIIDCCGEEDDAEAFSEVVLDFCVGDKEGFELFKNDDNEIVLANIVTSQYNYWLTTERLFSTFGIVFYDFELTPIIDENLKYISAADNYDSIKDAFEHNAPGVTYTDDSDGISTITYIQNPTSTSASVSASSDRSVTNSVSNSFSESDSYSFTESVSAGVNYTPIKDVLEVSVEVGFSASQAISTAYTEDKSVSETISTSSSASVTLPPYTEIGIKQTMSKTEQSVEYDCPVYLTYKVAVFGVNAQYIQDTGTGSWSITNYDQGSIFTNFGSNLKEGGLNAVDNLANRVKEKSKSFELSYGGTYGQYEDQNDGNPPKKITYLDWSKLDDTEDLDYCSNLLSVFRPMSAMGGKMTFKTDSYNTELTEIYPMYDLKKVRFEGDGTYNLAIGGDLDLNTINVVGLNKFDQPYYGFRPTMGTWHLCDEDGNDIPAFEEGKGIAVTSTPSTQVIEAHELGEYYLRFDIDEEFYTKTVDRKTYITNDDLDMTAILKLSVTDTGDNHICREGSWVTSFTSTCVSAGERCKYCLTCGKRMAVEVLPKAGHLPVEIIEPATCTVDGRKYSTCSACRVTCSSEVIPAKGHGVTTAVTTTTPTCTLDGEKTLFCSDCNTIVGSEKIEATGHLFGEYVSNNDATESKDGTKTATCILCSATNTVTDEGSKLVDTPDDCSHICHRTGISSIFWKIIKIFWKLFRMNPVCECGAAHY